MSDVRSKSGAIALQEEVDRAVSGYASCGVGVIRGLLSPGEITRLADEAEHLWRRFEGTGAANLRIGIRLDRSGSPILERLDPVADVSESFAALNRHPRLVSIAEQALGEPVTAMKEKLTYKRPGTPGFGPHRDEAYNQVKTGVAGSETATLCVALDHTTRANGAMEFFPSLHSRSLAAPPDEPRDIDPRELAGVESRMPELSPGDAVLFDGQVPHRSGWNRSDHSRRTYMITYVPARYGDARKDYYAARLVEQHELRRGVVAGPLTFE